MAYSAPHVFILIGVLCFYGCGFSGSTAAVKQCVRNSDQTGTFKGQWPLNPVPIAVKSGDFTAEEVAKIFQAAKTWNDFFQASKGIQIFDMGSASSPTETAQNKPSDVCNLIFMSGGKFIAPVTVYKVKTGWAYQTNQIAITSTCDSAQTPFRRIHGAMLEMNYQNYFNSGQRIPDLQSIIVHELGHAIGLGHSCEAGGTSTSEGVTADCNSATLPSSYKEAALFPTILFPDGVNGKVINSPQVNDQGRANCLYGPDTGTTTN